MLFYIIEMFNLIPNKMEKRSFGVGLIVASAVWLFTLACVMYLNEPVHINNCELIEDDIIDTEFEHLMIENRVKAYERGYYTCLEDTRPDLYKAYVNCCIQLKHVVGDPAFNKIVDAECAKNNINAQDKEYLCTLLLD